jgi:hypothetical protein
MYDRGALLKREEEIPVKWALGVSRFAASERYSNLREQAIVRIVRSNCESR